MKISQREARRLRRRVSDLEAEFDKQQSAWARTWPGGTNIARVSLENLPHDRGRIEAARMLGHAVVAVMDGHNLMLMAKKLEEV